MMPKSPWTGVPPKGIIRLGGLTDDQKLYRYMSFKRFNQWVKSGRTALTKVSTWKDKHEMPIQAPLSRQRPDEYKAIAPAFDLIFGQCWSLDRDSEGLWKSHTAESDSLMVGTTVRKLYAFENVLKFAVLSPIIYDDREVGSERVLLPYLPLPIEVGFCTAALVKRPSFSYEHEVRLVALNPGSFSNEINEQDKFVELQLDPNAVIEDIIISPDATHTDVESVRKFCSGNGLAVIPTKSTLYDPMIS